MELGLLEVDALGLTPLDRKLLIALIDRFGGGRVATKKAYDHMGKKAPKDLQEKLSM